MIANRPLRVCYFGTYRAEYARNRIMIAGLRRNGIQVVECHAALWQGVDDREEAVRGDWLRPRFWGQVMRAYLQLLAHYRRVEDYDVLVVGYPGQFDVFLARVLAWWRRKPLVWDVFMSIYLIALERGLARQHGPMVRGLRAIEWLACRVPDRLILDTPDYVAWFAKTHGVAANRFRLVPTGADSEKFRPAPLAPPGETIHIVYYGTFIPNHGVPYIIAAAAQLATDPAITFELIGQGPDLAAAQARVATLGLANVVFSGWLTPAEVAQRAAQADIVLGVFGQTPQSLMTIQNKIYEGLASAKPVISGNSPTVAAVLQHGEHIYLVDRSDPAALVAAIRHLQADPTLRVRLAQQGHQHFLAHFTVEQIGRRFAEHLRALVTSCTSS